MSEAPKKLLDDVVDTLELVKKALLNDPGIFMQLLVIGGGSPAYESVTRLQERLSKLSLTEDRGLLLDEFIHRLAGARLIDAQTEYGVERFEKFGLIGSFPVRTGDDKFTITLRGRYFNEHNVGEDDERGCTGQGS